MGLLRLPVPLRCWGFVFGNSLADLRCGMTQPQRRDHEFGNPVCIEKQRLQEEFIAACHDLNTLQSDQISAVIAGDSDFMRFDDLLHMARERKEQAKYILLSHIEEHRC